MPDDARIYRFGDVEVDTAAHRVVRGGEVLALEPKAYAVLLALLARPGHAIARDDLLDQVWGHRHVTPGVLNRVIAQLRRALGDEAEHPHYIQTLHAFGYRFMCVPEVHVPGSVDEEISTPPGGAEISASGAPATPAGAVPGLAAPSVAPPPSSPGEARPRAPAPGRDGAPRRAWPVVVALLLAVAVGGWWLLGPPRASAGSAAIAVRPFSMLGGGPDDAWFAEGLAVEMHDALASVPGLRVAALMSADDPRRHADVRSLGESLGVDAVLDASIRREGDRMRINARLSDARSGYVLWSRAYEHAMAELFATQGAIAGEVVEAMLGAMPEARETLRQRLAPTRSVAAFDAYLRGRHLERAPPTRARNWAAAEAFRTALAEDAGFALAQAALCTTETRRFEYWNDSDAHPRARAACARAAALEPMPPEAALAVGELHRVDGDLALARTMLERAAADPATAALAEMGLAKVAAAAGDQDGAARHAAAALERAPDDALVRVEAGFLAYREGRIRDAIAHYHIALGLAPEDAGAWNTYGFLQMLVDDVDEAARAFERSLALEPSADVLANLATLRSRAGDHEAATALHRRALELDPDDYINWGNLGDGLLAAGAPGDEVAAAYAEAERRVRRYLELDPGDGYALAALGWYSANLGRPEAARDMVRRSSQATRGDPAEIALYNAETLARLGEAEASREHLQRAREAGMGEARIRASPVLQ